MLTKKQAIKRSFIFPSHQINASALGLPGANTEKQKLHLPLKCCITALPDFNQLLPDFFNLADI